MTLEMLMWKWHSMQRSDRGIGMLHRDCSDDQVLNSLAESRLKGRGGMKYINQCLNIDSIRHERYYISYASLLQHFAPVVLFLCQLCYTLPLVFFNIYLVDIFVSSLATSMGTMLQT